MKNCKPIITEMDLFFLEYVMGLLLFSPDEDEELYNYTFEDQIIGKMQVRSNQKSSYYFYLN